jgi:hypothetical protein
MKLSGSFAVHAAFWYCFLLSFIPFLVVCLVETTRSARVWPSDKKDRKLPVQARQPVLALPGSDRLTELSCEAWTQI